MSVRLLLVLAVVALGLTSSARSAADDGDGRTDVKARGMCTGQSVSELRVRAEERALQIEFRIDQSRPTARRWTVLLFRERRIAFRGALRPDRGSRSVRLRRIVADWPGSEQIVVRAVAVDGEVCRASAVA